MPGRNRRTQVSQDAIGQSGRSKSPASEGLLHSTLVGYLWTSSGRGARVVLQLLVVGALARLLSPADFGVVASAMVVVGFADIFSTLGITQAIVQAESIETRHLRVGFTVSMIFGFLLAAMIWLLGPIVVDFFRIPGLLPVLRALTLLFPIESVSSVSLALLQRELRFRRWTGINIVSYIAGYGIVGMIMAWLGFGTWALVGAVLTQTALNSALMFISQPHSILPLFDARVLQQLAYFGGGITVARVFNYLALKGDSLVVGRSLGAEALGLYDRAYNLMATPVAVYSQSLDRVLFPSMAKIQDETQRLRKAYSRSVALVSLIALPSSGLLCILAPEIIVLWLGSKWGGVVAPFQVLVIGMIFRMGYKISSSLGQALGAIYELAKLQILYAVLVIGGSWIGQHYGIVGVAFGVAGALAVFFALMTRLSLSLLGMTWQDVLVAPLPAMRLAFVVSGEALIIALAFRHMHALPVVTLVVCGAVVAVTLALLLRVAPEFLLGRDGLWMLKTVAGYLPARYGLSGWASRAMKQQSHEQGESSAGSIRGDV